MEAFYKSKKSAWGAISIWRILLFGVIVPAILVFGPYIFKVKADAFIENSESIESSTVFMQKMAPFAKIMLIVGIILAAISFIVTVIRTIIVIYRAKQYSYEFCGNTLIVKEGAVFSGATENRRMHFFPGMNVSVKQTFKGKIFNYGDVVVSMGIGQAGQIVMQGIKDPKKAGRVLSKYAAEASNARANNRVSIFMPNVTGFPFFF